MLSGFQDDVSAGEFPQPQRPPPQSATPETPTSFSFLFIILFLPNQPRVRRKKDNGAGRTRMREGPTHSAKNVRNSAATAASSAAEPACSWCPAAKANSRFGPPSA